MTTRSAPTTGTELPRPGQVCRHLLAAMDASEGRRRRRKRDTKPDAIGMEIKRGLLERAAREDPPPEEFEEWLLAQCLNEGLATGPIRAMALDILYEWKIAAASNGFQSWLAAGAPSDDVRTGADGGLDRREIHRGVQS